jgi:peptide methionine sulfoxide reductase msrA/msrB
MLKKALIMAALALFIGTVTTANAAPQKSATAIFAGGCFWCMVHPFEELPGVSKVISGYTDGRTRNPTYENYAAGGHVEVVEVVYDPAKVSYTKLLDVFWRQIDPTDPGGQFVDRGPQYRSAIFYLDDEQKMLAEKSKEELARSGRFDKPIVTEIKKASTFWPAEEYHQDFYKKNKLKYEFYRWNCGRDQRVKQIWGAHKGDS